MTAAWYCNHYLPPVSWQFATGVVDTGGKFAAGIVDTGGKFATGINNTSEIGGKICRRCRWYRQQFCRRCCWHWWQICHRCRWYRWYTLTCEYLCEFSKKFETVLMQYSGAGWKLIHQKNQKQKISWHSPFKVSEKLTKAFGIKPMMSLKEKLFSSKRNHEASTLYANNLWRNPKF